MKNHAHMLGKDSSQFNDPKYGEEYRNILKEQQLVCFNYRNQQPLSAKENLKKNDIYNAEDEKKWVEHLRKSGYEGEILTLY